jgi:hypothetical protein
MRMCLISLPLLNQLIIMNTNGNVYVFVISDTCINAADWVKKYHSRTFAEHNVYYPYNFGIVVCIIYLGSINILKPKILFFVYLTALVV